MQGSIRSGRRGARFSERQPVRRKWCQHYETITKGLGSCIKVEGQIRPWMWCKLFKKS